MTTLTLTTYSLSEMNERLGSPVSLEYLQLMTTRVRRFIDGRGRGSGHPVKYTPTDVVVLAAWIDSEHMHGPERRRLLAAVRASKPGDVLELTCGHVTTVYRPRWELVTS